METDSNSGMTLRPQTVEELLFSLIESRNTEKYTRLNTRDFVTTRQLLFSLTTKKRCIDICSLSLARQHHRRVCFRCVEDWKRISNIYSALRMLALRKRQQIFLHAPETFVIFISFRSTIR